jgi:hypothetical protein
MSTIRIKTRLESETLVLPELRPLLGKTVEISVREQPESPIDAMIDWEYLAELEAEFAKDPSPIPSLEEVRSILARIPGKLSDADVGEREERF